MAAFTVLNVASEVGVEVLAALPDADADADPDT